jgi:hypothetical protein
MNNQTAAQILRDDPKAAEQAQSSLNEVLTRSATDMPFRQLLLSDPRAALSQHFGVEAPASVNLAFIENKADATVVLPNVIDPNAELSDAELEAVAGGILPALAVIGIGYCITWAADKYL